MLIKKIMRFANEEKNIKLQNLTVCGEIVTRITSEFIDRLLNHLVPVLQWISELFIPTSL
jgi:hypothetical protein